MDSIKFSFTGHITMYDPETGELILNTTNDALFGNLSSAIAYSLIGNQNAFLFYLALGNGGAYVSPTGTIAYKPSLGGASSLLKNPTANLYNTNYVVKLSTSSAPTNLSKLYVPNTASTTNYEDVVLNVTLGYNQPPTSLLPNAIQQSIIDNSTFVGSSTSNPPTALSTLPPEEFVFNELGLFCGTSDLFAGGYTETTTDVENFVLQTPNFSSVSGIKSKLMITNSIFSPIQKSANRKISINYTLRIHMGAV